MESTNNSEPWRFSISEMAQIFGISRQTLIYYDKIGLFKPYLVESNGYRLYSASQIPKLREICFLKSIGMPLEEIKKHNVLNSSVSTISLLTKQKTNLENEIARLNEQLEMVEDRLTLYKNAKRPEIIPQLKHFSDRFLVCKEIEGKPTRESLNKALMNAVNLPKKSVILPTSLYGVLFRESSIKEEKPLKGMCACFIIDEYVAKRLPAYTKLPEGDYICLKKYGMCYNTSILNKLLVWISENGYEVAGDIYEGSLMDGGLYDNPKELDFSEIQIPVKKVV